MPVYLRPRLGAPTYVYPEQLLKPGDPVPMTSTPSSSGENRVVVPKPESTGRAIDRWGLPILLLVGVVVIVGAKGRTKILQSFRPS